jgi:hypothetical protein
MKTQKYIFEQTTSENYTLEDFNFFQALNSLNELKPDINSNDYYSYINGYILTLKTYMPLLSDDAKAKINNNIGKVNDLFKTTNQNAYGVDSIQYENIKNDLSSLWQGVYAFAPTPTPAPALATPATGGGGAAPAVAAAGAATPAVAQAASGGGTAAATAQGVNKTALFQKYMGSYDPNSSMDKSKMGLVDQALETFKKENKADFTGSAEDITKMNKIMNDVYQSKEYASVVKGKGAATTDASKTTGQPTVKFGNQDMSTFIQVANGKFIPATEKDVQAGNQIWMKNPRKGQGEDQKPNYVQVRTEKGNSLRPKSQLPGALGSVSNLLGDIGRTLDKTSRTPRTKPKK